MSITFQIYMAAIPAYSFPFAFFSGKLYSTLDALLFKRKVKWKSGEKIFTLHLSMQRKGHKCKVLKVIGCENRKNI